MLFLCSVVDDFLTTHLEFYFYSNARTVYESILISIFKSSSLNHHENQFLDHSRRKKSHV